VKSLEGNSTSMINTAAAAAAGPAKDIESSEESSSEEDIESIEREKQLTALQQQVWLSLYYLYCY